MNATAKPRRMDELVGIVIESYYQEGLPALSLLSDNGTKEVFLELTPETVELEDLLDTDVKLYGFMECFGEDEQVFVVNDFKVLGES